MIVLSSFYRKIAKKMSSKDNKTNTYVEETATVTTSTGGGMDVGQGAQQGVSEQSTSVNQGGFVEYQGTANAEKQPLSTWGDTAATTAATTATVATSSGYEFMNRGVVEEKSHYVNLNTLNPSAPKHEEPQYANFGKGRLRKGPDPMTMSILRK